MAKLLTLPHTPTAEDSPLSQLVTPACTIYAQHSVSGEGFLLHQIPPNMVCQSDRKESTWGS